MAQASFRGEHHLKMDGKGRISIPADFRRVLESGDADWSSDQPSRMVINYRDELAGGFEINTYDGQAENEALVAALPKGSLSRKMAQRDFITKTKDLSLDDTGRIVMPQFLRDRLGLAEGMTILALGLGETFQMWNPDTYEAVHGAALDDFIEEQGEDFNSEMLLEEGRKILEARMRRDARE
ncbi:hypothetical protein [Pseudooceanicola sp.]|uniref:division/cell wall cluster transcriptional repressor MraZ n=1 Tax=Pseudooceanicola sp. TaxID=1914328 RepID=UPI00260FB5B7|nr:hypothetical protein [Pseudooceanicola sp.]MDF1854395.1 hypothetical protein [Pseudooceanicola sp.]